MSGAKMKPSSYKDDKQQYKMFDPTLHKCDISVNVQKRINIFKELIKKNGEINNLKNKNSFEKPKQKTNNQNIDIPLSDCLLEKNGNFKLDNTHLNNSVWSVVQTAYNNNEIYSYTDTNASLTGSFGETSTGKWVGGVLAPNKNIYCIPYNSTVILTIKPTTETLTITNLGADLNGIRKWWGGCLGSDGKIYGIPESANDILVIDTNNNRATRTTFGLDLTNAGTWTSNKWIGGVVGLDGKIYCIPANSTKILIINPSNQTAELTDFGLDLTGNNKWWGGCLGTDGKIYCIPGEMTDFLIIDTINKTAIKSNLGFTNPGNISWLGAVLGSDGKIYGVPYGTTCPGILIINTEKQLATIDTFGVNFDDDGAVKWVGGCLATDGKIYCCPDGAKDFLIIDPVKQTANRCSLGTNLTGVPTNRYRSCTLAENGAIYVIPFRRSELVKITHPSATPYSSFIARHPALNKF